MSQDPCEEIAKKKYSELITDESLRRRLSICLNKQIFKIDGIFFHYEKDLLTIEFTSQFFHNHEQLFFFDSRPSDTRLKKFHDTMKTIQKKLGKDFFVETLPSSTNLSMKVKFRFRKIPQKQGEDIILRDLLEYLASIWSEITSKLGTYHICITED